MFDFPGNEPSPPASEIQRLFVDEAGDPTLFNSKGEAIIETNGCSRFFIIGKLEVIDPIALTSALTDLRQELIEDSYFDGVPSFDPKRKKTALLFHAKDDLPEVRLLVFRLLRGLGDGLRFHAVVCDKRILLQREIARRSQSPGYRSIVPTASTTISSAPFSANSTALPTATNFSSPSAATKTATRPSAPRLKKPGKHLSAPMAFLTAR